MTTYHRLKAWRADRANDLAYWFLGWTQPKITWRCKLLGHHLGPGGYCTRGDARHMGTTR